MQAYEEDHPSYFTTPAVNLIQGLEVSLEMMLKEGMDARFARHRAMAQRFRDAMRELGLTFIPKDETVMGHTLSAPYCPGGVAGGQLLPAISANGVVVAGGLLPSIKESYFRIGHMGMVNEEHIDRTVAAIKQGLRTVIG